LPSLRTAAAGWTKAVARKAEALHREHLRRFPNDVRGPMSAGSFPGGSQTASRCAAQFTECRHGSATLLTLSASLSKGICTSNSSLEEPRPRWESCIGPGCPALSSSARGPSKLVRADATWQFRARAPLDARTAIVGVRTCQPCTPDRRRSWILWLRNGAIGLTPASRWGRASKILRPDPADLAGPRRRATGP